MRSKRGGRGPWSLNRVSSSAGKLARHHLCNLKRPLISAHVPLRAPVTLCI
jgi:hypothetical protein